MSSAGSFCDKGPDAESDGSTVMDDRPSGTHAEVLDDDRPSISQETHNADDAREEYERRLKDIMVTHTHDVPTSPPEGEMEVGDVEMDDVVPVIPAELPTPEVPGRERGSEDWKGIAIVAGLDRFESDWQMPLKHAKSDAGLVSEVLHCAGFNSVVDLSNNHVYTQERIGTHKSGQLSYWEMQTHFRNAAQIAGSGTIFFYLSTRVVYGPSSDKSRPPDCICTYDSDSLIKLEDFITKLASLITPECTAIIVLDLAVGRQYDTAALPNIASLCPPRFSVLLSLTPECASIFTPNFLKAITKTVEGENRGTTLKDVAWSDEINVDLARCAAACCDAEEAAGTHVSMRKWLSRSWIPLTAAQDLNDVAMNTTIGNPIVSNLASTFDDTKLLISLKKEVRRAPDNLTQMFAKLRSIEAMLGEGRNYSIVAMQPLQGAIVSQTSSTSLKSWEEFRSLYQLTTSELQKCDKEDPDVPANHMTTYFKMGEVYQPNSPAEAQWKYLENVYLGVSSMGRDFFFGTDPKAGLDSVHAQTHQACKCLSLSLILEPTLITSMASHVRLVCESRMPPSATTLLSGPDGVFTMKVHKLKQLLHPRNTGVRFVADTLYQKRQQERASAAKKMDISRAVGANQNGLVEPSPTNAGLTQWLQVSQEAQIESAIRIQSTYRMYAVRKRHRLMLIQIGESPRDGTETRRVVRQWLLSCSKHFTWHPLSSCIVCTCASGLPQRNPNAPYTYIELMQWLERLARLRSVLTERVCSDLGLQRNSVRVESITGHVAGAQFVVKLRAVSPWSGPGDAVPQEVRTDLDELAQRISGCLQHQIRDDFQISSVKVNTEKLIRGLEHTDVRQATCEQAIRAVLTGKSDLKDPQGLPPSIRRTLETGLDPNNDPRNFIIYALMADDECSVPMGWKRHVLEAPLLPGNAVCVAPRVNTPLYEALTLSTTQITRNKEFCHNKEIADIFLMGRLRGEKAMVYETPGVRQLDKTPLVMYSRYWADHGYYDDAEEFMVLKHADDRMKLMMHTVRERRDLKYKYDVSLFTHLFLVFFDQVKGCRIRFIGVLAMIGLLLTSIMLFLLPRWFSNVTALVYLSDMSKLSLEQIVTWILIYILMLLGCLFVTGACVSKVKNTFAYKIRTVFIYICAKYSRLVSSELVYTMRESDLRQTVSVLFQSFPKIFVAFFLGFGSLVTIYATCAEIGLVCTLYLLLKFALHTMYDKFMVRHMTAISNIEKEEQLRWVVLRGPQGAAGHVAAQAADDHQMRLCLFAREKRRINQSNMTVHTITAVIDWLMMFSLPAFILYVACNKVAQEDGQMAQQVEDIPYIFFYYLLLFVAWRIGLHAMVEVVEWRPHILRFLTVLAHIQLTEEEREEMKKLLDLDKDDTLLADQLHVTPRDDARLASAAPDAERAEPDGSVQAQAANGVTLRNRKGWYKRKMLLEFDWFNALLDQHPLSTVLLYLCFVFWLCFAVCVIIFIATSWASECKTIEARCKILDTYFEGDTISMPQEGDSFGRCLLMQPIALSLGTCANVLKNTHGYDAYTYQTGDFSTMNVALEYETWQAGPVGFYQTFSWNSTHESPCPVESMNFTSFRSITYEDINSEDDLTDVFSASVCGDDYTNT